MTKLEELKAKIGYRSEGRSCGTCRHYTFKEKNAWEKHHQRCSKHNFATTPSRYCNSHEWWD